MAKKKSGGTSFIADIISNLMGFLLTDLWETIVDTIQDKIDIIIKRAATMFVYFLLMGASLVLIVVAAALLIVQYTSVSLGWLILAAGVLLLLVAAILHFKLKR
jgi:hypothetical protein